MSEKECDSGWCSECGYRGTGVAVAVAKGRSLCTACAAARIRRLEKALSEVMKFGAHQFLNTMLQEGLIPEAVCEQRDIAVEKIEKCLIDMTDVHSFRRGGERG